MREKESRISSPFFIDQIRAKRVFLGGCNVSFLQKTHVFFGFSEPPAVETAHRFPGFHHFFSGKISPIDSTDTRLDGELESSKPRGIHLLETSRISG